MLSCIKCFAKIVTSTFFQMNMVCLAVERQGGIKLKKNSEETRFSKKKTEAVRRTCLKLFEARRPNFSKHSRGTGGGVKNSRCVRAQGVKISKFSEGTDWTGYLKNLIPFLAKESRRRVVNAFLPVMSFSWFIKKHLGSD